MDGLRFQVAWYDNRVSILSVAGFPDAPEWTPLEKGEAVRAALATLFGPGYGRRLARRLLGQNPPNGVIVVLKRNDRDAVIDRIVLGGCE